jgi:catechol-2,3-dioxygenase
VALAVPDIQEAKNELDRIGQAYWSITGVTGPNAEQVFMHDPAGNIIELHQAGTCRCVGSRGR